MRVLYLDAGAGLNLEMLCGALADLENAEPLDIGFPGAALQIETRRCAGVAGRYVQALYAPGVEDEQACDLEAAKRLLDTCKLTPAAKRLALDTLGRLVQVRARLESVEEKEIKVASPKQVYLLAVCALQLCCLRQSGVERILLSPLPLGTGVYSDEGCTLPVPRPLTLALLKGIPVCAGAMNGEGVTPLAAALAAQACDDYGPMPEMKMEAVGYGLYPEEKGGALRVLRAVLGEAQSSEGLDRICLLECNLDDMTGEAMGYVMEQLLQAGALDVYYTPIYMKKSRPATMLSVICKDERAKALSALMLRETTTLGVRRQDLERQILNRRMLKAQTSFGPIGVKVAGEGQAVKFKPEFEDCAQAARQNGVPLQAVILQASLEARAALERGE